MNAEVIFGSPRSTATLALRPEKNLVTGLKAYQKYFGAITSVEEDLLILASAIYACDLAQKRGDRENIARDFSVRVPLINDGVFNTIKIKIQNLLYLLSNDNWTLEFPHRAGSAEPTRTWESNGGKTALFSGGLDSFCGAVDLISSGAGLVLVSHYTHNMVTKQSQTDLHALLSGQFGQVAKYEFLVSGRNLGGFDFPATVYREDSQRTRSFLFLALGALVARTTGNHDLVVIAENGQMAIHLPLTAARIGAFSTHTAHPEVVDEIESILGTVLGFNLTIRNPYLYSTKAECVKLAVSLFKNGLSRSVSCWRGSRVSGTRHHCGICVPCMVRRIALEANGLSLAEYERDLFREDIRNLSPDDIGKRNLVELLELVEFFNGKYDNARLQQTYPALTNPKLDFLKAIDLHKRFSSEANRVFANYPNVKAIQ